MSEHILRSNVGTIETRLGTFDIAYHPPEELSENLIAQLIEKSKQGHVVRATKDGERFRDRDAFNEWAQKRRDVYPMLFGEDLAGITWYGEEPFPFPEKFTDYGVQPPNYSFAIRMYEGYLRMGYPMSFMKLTFQDYMLRLQALRPDSMPREPFTGMWLSTLIRAKDNGEELGTDRLYRRFGYKLVTYDDEKFYMALPDERVKELCGLTQR